MRQISATMQSSRPGHGSSAAETDDQHALMRGVVHGVLLSMIVWTAALSVALALR